jgi:hypothetical protein
MPRKVVFFFFSVCQRHGQKKKKEREKGEMGRGISPTAPS